MKPTIIVDSREQMPYVFSPDSFCAGSCTKKLNSGDYSISGLEDYFTVDRKRNTSEWSQNVIDERFERELDRMRQIPHSFILCEFGLADILSFPVNSGIPTYKHSGIKIRPEFILKRTMEIQVQYPTKIFFCGDRTTAIKTLTSLMKRIYEQYSSTKRVTA